MNSGKKRRRPRWFGWWYLAIGAGFLLLGFNRLVIGDTWPGIILRWLISVGFFALAYLELRAK